MSARTLLLFPDLVFLDPAYHDGANIAVEHFFNNVRNGYGIITMPSFSFGQAFCVGNNRHYVRVKLLSLISNILFFESNPGLQVCFSKWHRCYWTDLRFAAFLRFRGRCPVHFEQDDRYIFPRAQLSIETDSFNQANSYLGEIFVDLRFSDDYESIWMNISSSQLPVRNFCQYCHPQPTMSLHPQPTATPSIQARHIIYFFLTLFVMLTRWKTTGRAIDGGRLWLHG